LYEGEWNEHKMHGEGYFVDKDGNKWEGKFGFCRNNTFTQLSSQSVTSICDMLR